MKGLTGRCTILTATAMGVVFSTPAMAQDSSDQVSDSSTIIVTARRTEERLQDVPISITVFQQSDISKRNIFNSADLATYTPSLSVNSRFGPEKASFAIRGFVQDLGTAPSVGVYFADVVAPRSGGATTSGEGAGVGDLFDLQNVQVLKGPQGTLFGRNTTGGAVLLVPQKPTDRLEGYVEGSLGSYGMKRVQAVLNVPLADTFKVRLGVDRMTRDGYLINHSGIGPRDFNNVDYLAARLSVVADLTPDLENYTIATYSDSDNNGTVPRVIACNPASTFGYLTCPGGAVTNPNNMFDRAIARGDGWWDVENSDPHPKLHMTTWRVINTTTWQASDTLTIKNIASYAEFKEQTSFSLEGENWITPAGTPFGALIQLGWLPGSQNTDQSTFTEELQFQGRTSDGKLNWQAGGYKEVSNPLGYSVQETPFLLNCSDDATLQCTWPTLNIVHPIYGPLAVPLTSGSISIPFQRRWFRSDGLYAQGTYHLTDQLAFTAGVRYTWDKQTYEYDGTAVKFTAPYTPQWFCNNPARNGVVVNGVNTGQIKFIDPYDFQQCLAKDSAKSHKPTWTVDLEYKPTTDLLFFAKWSRGYRAGGVNPTYIPFNAWGPEKVDTYELGTKTSFRSGPVRGYVNVTGFYNDFSDQQIQAALIAKSGAPLLGGTAILNAGKSRILGVELDGSVSFFDYFKLDASYAYLNTKLQELSGVPADDPVPWVPGASPWAYVVPTAVVGGPLALSPKNRLSLTGTFTLPVPDSVGKLSVGATWVYTSKQWAARSDDAAFAAGLITFYPGFPQRNPGLIPATNLVNLNADWEDVMGAPVDLGFFMTNVTNEKFPLNMTNAFNSFGLESQIVNEPRIYGFRLKVRFGS